MVLSFYFYEICTAFSPFVAHPSNYFDSPFKALIYTILAIGRTCWHLPKLGFMQKPYPKTNEKRTFNLFFTSKPPGRTLKGN